MKIKLINLVIILSLFSSCTFNIKEEEEDIYIEYQYHNEDNVLIGTSTYVNGERHRQEVGYWDTGELYFVGEYRAGKKRILDLYR